MALPPLGGPGGPGGDLPFPPDGGPGFGGFGFPGFGKSFNLDVGYGIPGFFGGGGGYPGWAPYVPVTPLGGLWGFKGDLIVPIVAIGVAIFIFILIVLAVKYALAWKLDVLENLAGAKGAKLLGRRDAGSSPAEHLGHDKLNELADLVYEAIHSVNATSNSTVKTDAAPGLQAVVSKFKRLIS